MLDSDSLSKIDIKAGNENRFTCRLKWEVFLFLYKSMNCKSIGFEVKLEGPNGRIADLVGIDSKNQVYIVEVKSSKYDFGRDNNSVRDEERLRRQVEKLADSVRFAKELLKIAQSQPNPGKWELIDMENDLLVKSQLRLSRAQRRLNTFSTKTSYLGCADFHYLMASRGIIWPGDLPPFWGLIDEYENMIN